MASNLQEIVRGITDFRGWNHAQKIKFFAWFLHSSKQMSRVKAAQVEDCYKELHDDPPSNINAFLNEMSKRKPRVFFKDAQGYSLSGVERDVFQEKFGQREITAQVTKLLSDLPSTIPNIIEREFLTEALICFRHGAFRAAIVMCWNLSYDHLCAFVIARHLSRFNTQWPMRFAKLHANSRIKSISTKDDFSELKESEVIQICRSAGIISGGVFKILDEKLGKRNSAAHPNNIKFTQLQAEEFISDLVTNVVLTLT